MSASAERNPSEQASPVNFKVINLLMKGLERALELGAEEEARAQIAEQRAKSMEELAMRDSLTGLYTRRGLEKTYKGLHKASAYEQERKSDAEKSDDKVSKHSLLLLDIDHFKSVNDTLGHDAGDEILRGVAQVLSTRSRERDVPTRLSGEDPEYASRWGGEEMALLLPRADEQDATRVAEEIRQHIEQKTTVTASIGVVELDLSHSLDANVALADLALYEAKHQGRNRVIAYSSLPPEKVVA